MGAVLVVWAGYVLARTRPWHRRGSGRELAPALEPLDDVPVT